MKVKFQNIPIGERFTMNGKDISVGDIVDLLNVSAVYFIDRGLAIEVVEKSRRTSRQQDEE